jgi:hypothetical protein
MPCGGIYPVGGEIPGPCWVCSDKRPCDHFCDEWDTPLHALCIPAFLATEEGACVLAHKHTVIIDLGEGIVYGPIMHIGPQAQEPTDDE